MTEKPTQEQLDAAREVLEWFQEEEYKDDVYAADTMQAALDNLPLDMSEIG